MYSCQNEPWETLEHELARCKELMEERDELLTQFESALATVTKERDDLQEQLYVALLACANYREALDNMNEGKQQQ